MSVPIVRNDMRISHGKTIQAEVKNLGSAFLDTTRTKSMKKSVITLQTWIRQNFSPLVLCFFLSGRDEIPNETNNVTGSTVPPGPLSATSGVHSSGAISEEEKAVQLWATLNDLLNQFVVPSVISAIGNCQDQAVLSQTLVKSLALVRKDWNAFLTSTRFMLISLENESGRNGSDQVAILFRKAFQETVFKEFRNRLVASLHELVKQVRVDPARIHSVATDAQELIKQFFDDLNANAAGAATVGSNSSHQSEWAHSETKKLEDFHNIFIEPYKKKMKEQYLEVAQKFEMNNDLPGLLSWIPLARKAELDLVRSLFLNVYPADFEMLCNNIMYEFDTKVASQNALRLVDHNQFGVRHILKQLALENASVSWELKPLATSNKTGAGENTTNTTSDNNDHNATNGEAGASTIDLSSNDPNVLLNRLRDLYVVAATAQQASSMAVGLRSLPRTVTRNARATNRRIDQSTVDVGAHDVEAFAHFKAAIHEHGTQGIAAVVDSFRTGVEFPSEKNYAKDVCVGLATMLNQKNALVKNICENSPDVTRAYADAFKKYINSADHKPTFSRKRGDKIETVDHRYPDMVSQYVDAFLTSNDNDDNVEAMADSAVELLSFVSDKDIFVEVYRTSISRRFLTKEYSDKVRTREEIVLSRLKTILPANHVRKCGQGMMEDLLSSNTLNEEFQKSPLAQMEDLTFYPRILGSMNWPAGKPVEGHPIWNASLVAAQDAFTRWYTTKHATRTLRWQPERGNSIMKINFPKSAKEITMTIIQANILMHIDTAAPTDAFRDKGGLTSVELAQETGFKAEDVDCIIMSMIGLSAAYPQILRITGPNAKSKKIVKDVDRYCVNPDFLSKMKKLNLPAVPSKAGQREGPSDKEINGWRAQIAQAVIVRIMKSKQVMNHESLIRASIEHLERSFVAQPVFLKACIQELISKEYLERDDSDITVYKYRA